MTEDHLNNTQAVLFLLYSGSLGKSNSCCFRPIKFEGRTSSGVPVILLCCHLPGPLLWSHEWKEWCGAPGAVLAEQQWRLKSVLPFHPISDHFCHGKGKEEEPECWAEHWEKSLKKHEVGWEGATAWTHLTAHLTTAIADETCLLQPVWLSRALA